jgi:hypothetical protein
MPRLPNKKLPKRKPTEEAPEETSTEKSLRAIAVAMNAVANLLNEGVVPTLKLIADNTVAPVPETVTISEMPAEPPPPPKPPRKPKAEPAPACKHPSDKLEPIEGRPLMRCTLCNAVLDAPAPKPEEKKPEAPPAPKPPPAKETTVDVGPPSIDDVRAVAINYAGKHGKEKLGKVLAEFGAQNLSGVPKEKLAALMAKLQEG